MIFVFTGSSNFLYTLESRIIGGLDIVIIINNGGWGGIIGGLDGVEKIVKSVS